MYLISKETFIMKSIVREQKKTLTTGDLSRSSLIFAGPSVSARSPGIQLDARASLSSTLDTPVRSFVNMTMQFATSRKRLHYSLPLAFHPIQHFCTLRTEIRQKTLKTLPHCYLEIFRHFCNLINGRLKNYLQCIFKVFTELKHRCSHFITSPMQPTLFNFQTRQLLLHRVQASFQRGYPFLEKLKFDYVLTKNGMIGLVSPFTATGGVQPEKNLIPNSSSSRLVTFHTLQRYI